MNDEIIFPKNQQISPTTYVSKQDFINMIQNLKFEYIETAEIEFITAFKINVEKDVIEPKGFKIYLS